jgi:hypothetical protein
MISREQLIESYADSLIQGMNYESMEQFVYDTITENLENYSNYQLAKEVVGYDSSLFDLSLNEDLKDDQIVRKFVQANDVDESWED